MAVWQTRRMANLLTCARTVSGRTCCYESTPVATVTSWTISRDRCCYDNVGPKLCVNGVGIPVCTYQPAPVFPRGKEAKVLLLAQLFGCYYPEGGLTNIRVTKDPATFCGARS